MINFYITGFLVVALCLILVMSYRVANDPELEFELDTAFLRGFIACAGWPLAIFLMFSIGIISMVDVMLDNDDDDFGNFKW